MVAGQAKVPERRSVGAQLVCRQQFGREALFSEQLARQPERCALVPPALNQHIEDLALVVDSTPQVHVLTRDPDDHLVEVPAIARPRTVPPQPSCDHGTEFHNPAPHTLMRDVETALGQEILDVAVAKRETQIQPDRVLDERRRKPMSAIREMVHAGTLSHRHFPRDPLP